MESTAISAPEVVEKPQNGLAGLKHLRHDIVSGIVVSLVSLPLSSGIAIASGVPPVYGLISAIIAGILFPLIGGAYMTIAGPAAGLAPALVAIMASMGGVGDADHVGEGYHYLLVVICMVGCIQMVMALFRLAKYCAIIPVAVVEGMLASIGLIIIVKQLPMFFGYHGSVHAHEFFEFVTATPEFVRGLTTPVFAVSFASLVLLFYLGSLKNVALLKIVPPQLIAVIAGTVLGVLFHLKSIGPGYLINLPAQPFHGIHFPDFAALFGRPDLWYAALVGVATLTMIDGVESLATAMAVDRIDPYHRKSQPNRVLFAMGLANVCSSLVGGLTIIPGGVKSKVNIASGGRTLWANFTNSICLVIYLVFARDLINMIPKGVLAAVLIYTGWKMCEPLIWNHIAAIGREQLGIFGFTVLVTLFTDLLWGIVAGVAAKFLLNLYLHRKTLPALRHHVGDTPTAFQTIYDFFANPVIQRELRGDVYHLKLNKPLVCFNSMKLSQELERVPPAAKSVEIELEPGVSLIDHTSCENLLDVIREFSDVSIPVKIAGMDRLSPLSEHHASTRLIAPAPSPVAVASAV